MEAKVFDSINKAQNDILDIMKGEAKYAGQVMTLSEAYRIGRQLMSLSRKIDEVRDKVDVVYQKMLER